MKIEKISETKIKVTLSINEIAEYNISFDNLLPDNEDTNELILDIIHKVNQQTGITFDNCKLLIEMMQIAESKCIMIISKKDIEDTKPARYKFYKKKKERKNIETIMVFEFKGMEEVASFAKNNLYYCFLLDGKNSLYRDGKSVKLVIEFSDELVKFAGGLSDRMCEYACLCDCSNFYASYLNEYCKPIIKNNALKIIYYKM